MPPTLHKNGKRRLTIFCSNATKRFGGMIKSHYAFEARRKRPREENLGSSWVILEQYENITPLPELRLMLMDEYFKNGAFFKALSHAYLIYDKYPLFRDKIISKWIVLENISELSPEQKIDIPENLLKTEIKFVLGFGVGA